MVCVSVFMVRNEECGGRVLFSAKDSQQPARSLERGREEGTLVISDHSKHRDLSAVCRAQLKDSNGRTETKRGGEPRAMQLKLSEAKIWIVSKKV